METYDRYGVKRQDDRVFIAYHNAIYDATNYFEGKADYLTFESREDASREFISEIPGDVRYGYQLDGSHTFIIVAAAGVMPDGFKGPFSTKKEAYAQAYLERNEAEQRDSH